MELDQLKDIWKGLDEQVAGNKTDQQILAMLNKKSRSPIAKIKRNLRWELGIMVITYTVMILYYFFAFEGKLQEVSWFMISIAVVFLVYYYRKDKLLREMQCVSCQVKSNLERQVNTLEKYVRFYLIAGTALVPLCLFFFGYIFHEDVNPGSRGSIFYISPENPWWKAVIAWTILVTVFTIPVYFLNVWSVKKLYGNHIRKLKSIISELSEND
jgi:hypothetical protein